MTKRYRQIVPEVEAMQFIQGQRSKVSQWCGGEVYYRTGGDDQIIIVTKNFIGHTETGSEGCWVVRLNPGNFFPQYQIMSDHDFRAKYEEVQ